MHSLPVASSCFGNPGIFNNELDLKCLDTTYPSVRREKFVRLKFALSVFRLPDVKLVVQTMLLIGKYSATTKYINELKKYKKYKYKKERKRSFDSC